MVCSNLSDFDQTMSQPLDCSECGLYVMVGTTALGTISAHFGIPSSLSVGLSVISLPVVMFIRLDPTSSHWQFCWHKFEDHFPQK